MSCKTITREEFSKRRDAGEPTWENGRWSGASVQLAASAVLCDVSWNGGEPFEVDCRTLTTSGIPAEVKGGGIIGQPPKQEASQPPAEKVVEATPAEVVTGGPSENQSQPAEANGGDPQDAGAVSGGDPAEGTAAPQPSGRAGIKLGKT